MRSIVSFAAIICVSLASITAGQSLSTKSDYSDSYLGSQLLWKVAQYSDVGRIETARGNLPTIDIYFGLTRPYQYDLQADALYPLVIYLHGAGARGSQISSVLRRQTAREFAWHGQNSDLYAAFVIAPQVPSGELWAGVPWTDGPYDQTEVTYTDSMYLTDRLIKFLVDPNNNAPLGDVLGIDANDIDATRIYVVGDSMGAYGTWDIVGRHPGSFAAAIAASGSGPKNKLQEISQTPFWAIHGAVDSTVPNRLPTTSNPDGDGSLGMLALLDPTFDNTITTDIVRLDDYATSEDDPNVTDTLIYTEFPSSFNHSTVATQWTTLMSGTMEWLFSHPLPQEPLPSVMPMESLEANEAGIILTINGIDVNDLVLGVTVFPNPPKHADPDYHADKADNFELSNGASGDDQPYFETIFSGPVTTIFMVENNGNDSGYFQAIGQDGNDVGPMVPFTAHSDYLKTDYRFFLNQRASGIVFKPPYPVYGLRIIKPDDGNLGFDAISVSGIPAVSKVMPMTSLEANDDGIILAINGIGVNDLVLGITTFPNPPKHANPDYHADKADNFELSNGASGDDQPYFETMFAEPVITIFMVENNGNDSGYFQALDQDGSDIGPMIPFTAHSDYLKTDYRFFLNQRASGIVFEPPYPVYGLRIIKPDDGNLGFDAISVSGMPVP
jgi:pimeloyl-ACP methyl ester carboxylesterase